MCAGRKKIEQINISKSKYCNFLECPKILWLLKYKPEEFKLNQSAQGIISTGTKVGEYARNFFGDFVDVTAYKDDGKLDISKMIEKTKEEINKGAPIICEASFDYYGRYCAVDILKREKDGFKIYEVKSSATSEKDKYLPDLAYQKYVLEKCGMKVIGIYLMHINGNYIFEEELDIKEFFIADFMDNDIEQEEQKIEENLQEAKKILDLDLKNEPQKSLIECKKREDCAFWEYCFKNFSPLEESKLSKMKFKDKIYCYEKGFISLNQLMHHTKGATQRRQIQLDCIFYDKPYIEKAKINEFLDELKYPIYFLDFETLKPIDCLDFDIEPVFSEFKGCTPYQQVPFQYSLHYIESPGGKLKHKEFLDTSGIDPRRLLAEQLCKDIPKDACVLAYHKQFECTRLKELAKAFPDLSEHLLNIQNNVIDLKTPFQERYYHTKEMNGSASIKKVLPALFPNDAELSYQNLDGVQSGTDAMSIFPKIKNMSPDEAEKARKSLLEYCKLDTLAMVKIFEKLIEVSK